jgi:hypothetical protein
MRCARIVRVLALALLPAALAATAALAQPAQAASSSSIVSSATSPAHGQPITFTATVTGGGGCAPAAGDAVVFSIDDVTVQTAQLSAAGMASYTTSDLTSGQHTIAAQYTGNTGCAPSSASLSQLVGGAGASLTTLAVGSSTQPTTATTVFTATVSGTASPCIAPSGSVTFRESSGGASQVLGTAPLGAIYAGQALFGEAGLSAGLHTFVAVYPGDANCAPSVSGTASVNVIGPLTPAVRPGAQPVIPAPSALGITILTGVGSPATQALRPGCTAVSLSSSPGTPVSAIASLVSPPGAVTAIWRFDAVQQRFLAGFLATPGAPLDFTFTAGNDETYAICTLPGAAIHSSS